VVSSPRSQQRVYTKPLYSKDNKFALLWAAEKGPKETVQFASDYGAEVNCTEEKRHHTALHVAAWGDYLPVVKLILDNDAVKLLLQYGADVEKSIHETPIYLAAQEDHTEVTKALVEHGANPNVAWYHGRTPLSAACTRGHLNALATLIKEGADVTATEREVGRTALHLAAQYGHLSIVSSLLWEKDIDVETKDKKSEALLILVAEQGHLGVVALLVHREAEVNANNLSGWSPLLSAILWTYLKVIDLLIETGKVNPSKRGLARTHYMPNPTGRSSPTYGSKLAGKACITSYGFGSSTGWM
jgi:ankyrin